MTTYRLFDMPNESGMNAKKNVISPQKTEQSPQSKILRYANGWYIDSSAFEDIKYLYVFVKFPLFLG